MKYLILLVWLHVFHLPKFANDRALPVHTAASTQTFHCLFILFLRLDELNVVRQTLESWEKRSVIHEKLPVCRVVPDLVFFLKDQVVIEAKIGALILHLVWVDLLALEGIPVVLLEKLVKQWVIFRHSGHIGVEDHFFLVECSLVWRGAAHG